MFILMSMMFRGMSFLMSSMFYLMVSMMVLVMSLMSWLLPSLMIYLMAHMMFLVMNVIVWNVMSSMMFLVMNMIVRRVLTSMMPIIYLTPIIYIIRPWIILMVNVMNVLGLILLILWDVRLMLIGVVMFYIWVEFEVRVCYLRSYFCWQTVPIIKLYL